MPTAASDDILLPMKHAWLVMVVLIASAACHRDTGGTPSNTPEAAAPSGTPGAPANAPAGPAAEPAAPAGPAGRPFAGYPPLEDACVADDDCGLVEQVRTDPGLTGCCRQCNTFVAGTQAWVTATIEACIAAGPCNDPLNCPMTTVRPFIAACEEGRCVVRRDPAVWGEAR